MGQVPIKNSATPLPAIKPDDLDPWFNLDLDKLLAEASGLEITAYGTTEKSDDKPTYPADHVAAMRVPKGGSSCSSCEYLKPGNKCGNEHFIEWHGSEDLPFPANEFCSDWYEPANKNIEAYGTSDGAEKAWDTRGRGRSQEVMDKIQEDWEKKIPFGDNKTFYHGTINKAMEEVVKKGLVQSSKTKFNFVDPEYYQPVMSQKGYVFMTKDERVAKWYGYLKSKFAALEPGGKLEYPDPAGNCCFKMMKMYGGDGADQIKDAKPVVVTLQLSADEAARIEHDPDSSSYLSSFRIKGEVPKEDIVDVQVMDDPDKGIWQHKWDATKREMTAEGKITYHIVYFGDLKKLEDTFSNDIKATAIFRGVEIHGFTKPEEEMLRACISRVPPQLLENCENIIADKTMGAKHGRYLKSTNTIVLNPSKFPSRQRFGRGPGWMAHMELTIVHEIGHSVYEALPDERKQEWQKLSGWVKSDDPGLVRYVEKRNGWPKGKTEAWGHDGKAKFTRHYGERNPSEDFAECFAFYILGKPQQCGDVKRQYMTDLIGTKVTVYPQTSIQGPIKAYSDAEERDGHGRWLGGANWVKDPDNPDGQVREIPISKIVDDTDYAHDDEYMKDPQREVVIKQYMQKIQDGKKINTPVVASRPDGRYTLGDGRHRLEAVKRLGAKRIKVTVVSDED